MSLSSTDAIAWLAVLVASLAALYARWAASEARKANKIALQARREEIYNNLLDFHALFHGFEACPSAEQVDRYNRIVVVPTRLYFSNSIASQVESVWNELWNSSRLVMALAEPESQESRQQLRDARSTFHGQQELLSPVIRSMKVQLSVQDV